MERISLSRLVIFIVFCFASVMCYAQQNYFVFKKRGVPMINNSDVLERGAALTNTDTLLLRNTDYVLLVNELGALFEIAKPNKYSFSAIKDFRRELEGDSFTKKYFAYVWAQFTNQRKKKQEAGVVYREERIVKLISPQDSVQFFSPEVDFTWQNNTDKKNVFFFLRDLENNHLIKIGITGNSITLNLDNYVLKSDHSYEWSVSTDAFPNLKKLEFNRLNVLSRDEFEHKKKEMKTLIKAFKILGYSEAEIKEAICLDYKFCSF